jgi:hypothetical protein
MASSNGAIYMTYKDGLARGTDCYLGSGSASALDEYKNDPSFAARVRTKAQAAEPIRVISRGGGAGKHKRARRELSAGPLACMKNLPSQPAFSSSLCAV